MTTLQQDLDKFKSAAKAYAARGWAAFPVVRNDKIPATAHGFLDATTDEAEIDRLWRDSILQNVGIATGESGLVVVDIDTKAGKRGAASWAALCEAHGCAETYTVRTWSGGLHYYYLAPEEPLRSTQGVLGPDIDTRAQGGYVVAAPSVVREGEASGRYEVINDMPLAPCPQWIIEALRKPEPRARIAGPAAPDAEVEAHVRRLSNELAAIPFGAPGEAPVNNNSYKAGQFVGAGQIGEEDAIRIMLDGIAGWQWAKPGDERKMHEKVERGVRDGATNPRTFTTSAPRLSVVNDDGTIAEAVEPEVGGGQFRMATRMHRAFGENLRFTTALGWHVYDETRWVPDEDGTVRRLAHQTIRDAYADVPNQDGSDGRKALVKDIAKVESASGSEGMLYHLSSMIPVGGIPKDPFDKDPALFNTPAGTIDLMGGGIRPARREDLISKVSNAPIGDVESGIFAAFLERILPDPEVRAYVQRLFGQAMYGSITEHILPIFTGTGRNGKGTLRDAVLYAFGEYAIEVGPELLMEQKNPRHGTYMLELLGRRLVFTSETDKGRRFAEATMKRLVGGDPIQGQRMHRDPITFDPSHTLILLTNHLPAVSGDDPAVWARIQVVPFNVEIPREEQDGHLKEKLRAEAPAVLAWVYQGWLDYREGGLRAPDAVLARTAQYQEESDVTSRFLADCTDKNQNATVRAADLYGAYTAWCHAEGEVAESGVLFSKSLKVRGFEKKRTAAGQAYVGLMLLAAPDDPYDDKPF